MSNRTPHENWYQQLTPRRITQIHCLLASLIARERIEPAQEQRAKMVRSCPRDGLHARDALFRDGGRVLAEDEFGSGGGELGQARDG